ncbi:MAG: glycerophosphodiester phosphodiesterase family protein [Desulfobacteraceae bacterium]|jgi:glycerophosphoryl diester phosphodiesterase
MHAIQFIELAFQRAANAMVARWPRAIPGKERLSQCKLIAHRGDHLGSSSMENTLDAFQASMDAGVWGIELDIRWTRDLVPVVAHDADLLRLHGDPRTIQSLSFAALQERYPTIPALEEVVSRFGGRPHLMIEIKQQPWPDLNRQNDRLCQVLAPLAPTVDYHLLCMQPHPLRGLVFAPSQAKALIAYHWPDKLSRYVMDNQWAGLCGHYLLMHGAILRRHRRRRQRIGAGFVDSLNCLFRELHREIDWIFSNSAAELQTWINRYTASTH